MSFARQSTQTTASKTIRVVAPATLEQDFTFDVTLGGSHGNRPYTVTVPIGGVIEGEEFEIPYPSWDEYSEDADNIQQQPSNDNSDIDKNTLPCFTSSQDEDLEEGLSEGDSTGTGAPKGRWRNHLCSCCDVITQSTFWMALFCIPILLAQLVSRLHLSYKGIPTLKINRSTTQTIFEDAAEEASLSYNKIVLSFVIVLSIANLLPAVGFLVVAIYIFLLMLYVGSNIRRSMRQMYKIPHSIPILQSCRRCFCRPIPKKGVKQSLPVTTESHDGGGYVEDFLCMFFCGCCTMIQMARHTHNDKEYPGYCCTTTGLEVGAPKIV